jgi:WD40 repeat protein
LASAAKDGGVLVWDVDTKPGFDWPLVVPDLRLRDASFSFDSRLVAAVDSEGSVSVRDARDLRLIRPLPELGTNNLGAMFSPRRLVAAVGNSAGTMTLVDLENPGKDIRLHGDAKRKLFPVSFTADGRKILGITGGEGAKRCFFWDVATGEQIASWQVPASTYGLDLSPDGKFLAAGQSDGAVLLWDVANGSGEALGNHGRKHIGGVSFTPDGGRLVSADWFGAAMTWDLTDRTLVKRQKHMHMMAIHSLDHFPDGRRFVTAGGGSEAVKVWDSVTGRELTTLSGPGYTNHQVEVSPDGGAILAINVYDAPMLWRVPSWDEIRAAEELDRSRVGD